MGKEIKIRYDREGDYLEVIFERKAGYFRETGNDAVMEKVDAEGNILGFSILKVSALKEREVKNNVWWKKRFRSRYINEQISEDDA
jgi:uncharacterized protein YuzE